MTKITRLGCANTGLTRHLAIKEGYLIEAAAVSFKIPEFVRPYTLDSYERRLKNQNKLILTAVYENKTVGFKIGYDRYQDGSFYSWMGGVMPEFRRLGIAGKLADYQENWAKTQGFNCLRLKTLPKHEKMILFSNNRGFLIIDNIPNGPDSTDSVWMEKTLNA